MGRGHEDACLGTWDTWYEWDVRYGTRGDAGGDVGDVGGARRRGREKGKADTM